MSNCCWLGLRKHFDVVFSITVRSPHNKRTMEAGLWGIWAFRPNAKLVRYLVINVME